MEMKILKYCPGIHQVMPYPGSKTRLSTTLKQLIPPHIDTIYSPFCGSSVFEIALAHKGYAVHASDKLNHIINLLQCVQNDKERTMRLVNTMIPCNKDTWKEYVRSLSLHFSSLDKWEAAAMTYVAHVYSLSGLVKGRFNDKGQFLVNGYSLNQNDTKLRSKYRQLKKLHIPDNIQFGVADYKDVLQCERSGNAMLYLDPPYDINDYLYGFDGHGKERFDHVTLRDALKKQSNWILSYGETDNIRELYSEYKILEYAVNYSMNSYGNTKKAKELVILSKDISDYWDDNSILSYGEQ